MRASFIIAGLVGAIVIGNAPAIITEASAAPTCEHRTAAHIAEHGGSLEDSRWHVAHGELPNCDEETSTRPVPVPHNDDDQDDDNGGKSRYCRQHFFC